MVITHFTWHVMICVNCGSTMSLRRALKQWTRSQRRVLRSSQSLRLKDGLTIFSGTGEGDKRTTDRVRVFLTCLMYIVARYMFFRWRGAVLLLCALDSVSSGTGRSPGWGHFVVFLDKKTSLSRCLFPPLSINGYQLIFRET